MFLQAEKYVSLLKNIFYIILELQEHLKDYTDLDSCQSAKKQGEMKHEL